MNLSDERAGQITGGLWLIGLGLLFYSGQWWPGILFLIGISSIVQGLVEGRGWYAFQGGFWCFLIGFWAYFHYSLPMLFVGIGASMILGATASAATHRAHAHTSTRPRTGPTMGPTTRARIDASSWSPTTSSAARTPLVRPIDEPPSTNGSTAHRGLMRPGGPVVSGPAALAAPAMRSAAATSATPTRASAAPATRTATSATPTSSVAAASAIQTP